jgi:hypothetical protein
MLSDLIPMIDGEWWLCGGGMLGLHRDGDLIEWDNDLDIMILPTTKINVPIESNYEIQDYYMDRKFYRKDLPKYKTNLWSEYLRYFGRGKNLNRPQLYKLASESYKQNRIVPRFSEPYIDIYTLKPVDGGYVIPFWDDQIYKDDELFMETKNVDLGYPVYLPGNLDEVCRRCYGETWNLPIPDSWKTKQKKI